MNINNMCMDCDCFDDECGYCNKLDMQVYEWEHCSQFRDKKKAMVRDYVFAAIFGVIAIIIASTMLTSCSKPELPKTTEHVVFEVSDKPAPDYLLHPKEEEQEVQSELPANADEMTFVHSVSYVPSEGQLTKAGGVNYYNDKRETWYSSNKAYHYRTSEWTAGDDGVYRDSDGYVVIASSDMPMGSTHETSLGMAKVYDTGCDAGTVDVYVNW